ncbi:HAD-IA family hydrolase [Nodosilinea sp. P-1105]|uniref:HAD family hydrolase n=1 Tax=Nodosilinea sp. P-1105 TaxID=2546229 RepID=UPI00146F09F8|nr:HAD-IA family hydrolase [Nodosilinea sp. P-1105]
MTQVRCQQQLIAPVAAIIFDKDGTLADSREFLRQLAIARAETITQSVVGNLPLGPSALIEMLLARVGVTADGLAPDGLMAVGTRQANVDAAIAVLTQAGYPVDQAFELVNQAFFQVDQQSQGKAAYTPPYEGTKELLQRLKHSAIQVGVLSSDSSAYVKEFLDHYGLTPWVDQWQGTDAGDLPKPDPTLFYGLCDRLQVNPSHTIIVGDSWVDRSLAVHGGATFLSVSEPWGRSPVPGAHLVLHTWDDLQVDQ